jgi:uncharacterized protein YbjT (DUF2867 family)
VNDAKKIRIILTGATGMVGEGVLFNCLESSAVDQVLMVNRRPYPMQHPKLKELLVPDFFELDAVADQLAGYDACFYCAGISSVGLSEADYTRITYDTTLHFAQVLAHVQPGMVFIYVSGAQTDSTEQGKTMWARVKGRTENALGRLGFRAEYNFRPGFMKAYRGQRNLTFWYYPIAWLYPLARLIAPNWVSTMQQVGNAMIHATRDGVTNGGAPTTTLEVKDINALAKETV